MVAVSTVIWKFPNVGSVELRFIRSVDSGLAAARDRRVLLGSRVPVGSSHPKVSTATLILGILFLHQPYY